MPLGLRKVLERIQKFQSERVKIIISSDSVKHGLMEECSKLLGQKRLAKLQ